MATFTTIKDNAFVKDAAQKVKVEQPKKKKKASICFTLSDEAVAILEELKSKGMNRSAIVDKLILNYKEVEDKMSIF